MVWRGGRQTLRDDAQRYGQDEAGSEQSSGAGRAVHDSRENNGTGIRRDGTAPAAGRLAKSTQDHHAQISAGETVIAVLTSGRVHRDQLRLREAFWLTIPQS